MKYIIGLDIGTSSIKGVLMEETGWVKVSAKEIFHYSNPQQGWVELEPSKYLETCCKVVKKLTAMAEDGTIVGVCASSASGNLLLIDENSKPLTNIIGWQDKRVTDECAEVFQGSNSIDGDKLYEQIGWPFDGKSFPLAQLCYLKKHQPELLKQCSKVCMSTEYLYYVWTGKWGISTSTGTPFYLIDQKEGKYIAQILDVLGLEENQVPPVMPAGSVLGGVQQKMAETLGVSAGTPVVLGTFDHPSAARGVGILEEGEMLLSCGTSWVVFMPVALREKGVTAKVLIDPYMSPKGDWAVMASVTSLSERIHLYTHRYIGTGEDCFQKLSALAAQSSVGAGGLRINILDEPDDYHIQSFEQKDIAMAIMEGTVHMLKAKLDDLKSQGITADKAVMVGGPSEDPMWHKLIRDMCGISVRVEYGAFAGAVGAAVMAGIGVGIYKDEKEAKEFLCVHKQYKKGETQHV